MHAHKSSVTVLLSYRNICFWHGKNISLRTDKCDAGVVTVIYKMYNGRKRVSKCTKFDILHWRPIWDITQLTTLNKKSKLNH